MRIASFRCPLKGHTRLRVAAVVRHVSVRFTTRDAVNPLWLETLYRDGKFMGPEHQGPVQVVDLPGRGRGVVAAADLQPGQVLLVSKPAAFVTCPIGSIPSPDELASVMEQSSYSPEELRTLNSLFAGADWEDEEADGNSELDDLKLFGIIGCNAFGEEFADFPTCMTRSAAATADASSTGGDDATYGTADGGTGDGSDGGGLQVGHLGLFPSFSMLNHSCLPNAVNFVVGDRMMVIAARNIRRGSEVLINYLGRASLRPVDERQATLAEGYHFSCDCPRCRTELLYDCTVAGEAGGSPGHHSSLAQGLQDILARCDERSAELDELGSTAAAATATATSGVGDGDADGTPGSTTAAALGDLLSRVRQDIRHLDELIDRSSLPAHNAAMAEGGSGAGAGTPQAPQTEEGAGAEARRYWLQASAFDVYSQHAVLLEVLGLWGDAVAAVGRQVALCEAVAPGSDLHMYMSVKRAQCAEQVAAAMAGVGTAAAVTAGMAAVTAGMAAVTGGSSDCATATEWRRCEEVLRARYGAGLSDETVGLLLRGAVYGLSHISV